MSPEQILALRHQIHAFKLILNESPVPDIILQGIKPASTAETPVVSSEGSTEVIDEDSYLLVDRKLNQNQDLIRRCLELQAQPDKEQSDRALNVRELQVNLTWLAVVADRGPTVNK